MKQIFLAIIAVFVLFAMAQAGSDHDHDHKHGHKKKRHHKAHVHGSGKLEMVAEGNELQIELEIPGHDVVGFEHQPKNKKQKKMVSDAIDTFKQVSSIVAFPEAASCKVNGSPEVETELAKGKGHDHGQDHDKSKGEIHAEFKVKYKFTCKKMKNLKSITVNAFRVFSGMKTLKASGLVGDRSHTQTLTPKNPLFKLGK